jgi:hypothetical protein
MVEYLLQQGIMQKLVDMCIQTPNNRWAAVGVLCAVLKSEDPLHKSVALRKSLNVIDILLLELTESTTAESQDIVPENSVSPKAA